MNIKITIDNKDIKNPIAKFLVSVIMLVIALIVFIVLFFLILPFVWFFVLSVLLVVLVTMGTAPKLITTYKAILMKKDVHDSK